MSEQQNPPQKQPSSRTGRVLALVVLIYCVALAAVYLTRPDSCAAITVCPAWVWSAPAFLVLLAASVRRSRGWLLGGAWLAWLLYLPALADTPTALLRGAAAPADGESAETSPDKIHVRVISLNCGGYGRRSAADVLDYHPQIVLLQESPGPQQLAALALELYGERGQYLRTSDASIVADGAIEAFPVHDPMESRASYARVRLADGVDVAVVSLRLKQAIVRVDFWSPDCWRQQTENRRERRRELRTIAENVATIPGDLPLVLGGDFNAPAGDAVFRELSPRLRDAFLEAGAGWGNTIINEFPFARIDQIWVDDHWQATTVRAQRTLHSDHRMVIADLILDRPAAPEADSDPTSAN